MYSRIRTNKSIGNCSAEIARAAQALARADAIVVGAGSGLSVSAGYTYAGERFERYFSDFHDKYGITDMYSGGFFPYSSPEEYWAWWSRQIFYNSYVPIPNPIYEALLKLLEFRDYFVLTTNVDHCFQRAGFDKKRLFYTQGDYGLFQCSEPCCQRTYDNEDAVRRMLAEQQKMRIPTELIPHCPICGRPMTMHLRCDDRFVEDDGWHAAANRYAAFIGSHKKKRVVYLELGVGGNTPGIIKYPFWRLTAENRNARYVFVNLHEGFVPEAISDRTIHIKDDIGKAICRLNNYFF